MGLWVWVLAGTGMGYRGDTHGFSYAIAYELTKVIGVEITQTKNSISISQKTYIESTLECKGLSEINSVVTPMDLSMKLRPNLERVTPSQDLSESSNILQIAPDPIFHLT